MDGENSLADDAIALNTWKLRIQEKIKRLAQACPEELLGPILEEGTIGLQSGSVEHNVALRLRTCVRQIREWERQSPEFRFGMDVLRSQKTGEVLRKLEDGEIPAGVADRIAFANGKEVLQPPSQANVAVGVKQLPERAIENLLALGDELA